MFSMLGPLDWSTILKTREPLGSGTWLVEVGCWGEGLWTSQPKPCSNQVLCSLCYHNTKPQPCAPTLRMETVSFAFPALQIETSLKPRADVNLAFLDLGYSDCNQTKAANAENWYWSLKCLVWTIWSRGLGPVKCFVGGIVEEVERWAGDVSNHSVSRA